MSTKPQRRGIHSLKRAIKINVRYAFQNFGGKMIFPELTSLSDFQITKVFLSQKFHVGVNF